MKDLSSRALFPLFLIACLYLAPSSAFYLPGVSPHDYSHSSKVELLVNALTSHETMIPYDYYYDHFHFCRPEKGFRSQSESLGSILFGDRLYDSPFELKMGVDESCKVLCNATVYKRDAEVLNQAIRDQYMMNWVVDGLPVAKEKIDLSTKQRFYSIGFELGNVGKENKPYLHNHYVFVIQYHKEGDIYRVVGVLVWPFSIKHLDRANSCIPPDVPDNGDEEAAYEHFYLDEKQDNIESKTPWGTRWDNYLYVLDPKIHWFSLINSVIIVLFLSGMVAMILFRTLHRDIARYNKLDEEVDDGEELDFGWKLVHGDVFRAPSRPMLLSVLIGSGAQILMMAGVTLIIAVLGFVSPSSRGSLTTVMLVFYVCFGSGAGYYSARMYKMFGGEAWRKNVLLTAFMVPGTIFAVFVILNFFLVGSNSSGAVPFGTMFALIVMWFLISAPLCLVGAYFGFKKAKIEHPVRTNQIPRQVPDQV
ncbi:hypothetical protein HK098_005426 [Nowakowskiella sp. JEL0407]|nr:hypothetical protein HK098_005426 [Nowakowskiella sp. JEL0407]